MALNKVQRPVQVPARLLVYRDPVGPCLGEIPNILIGVLYHQMAIERQPGCLAERFNHWRPNRQIGHKMAIHDVHVDDAAAARGCPFYLIRQVGKVGRQY